MSEKAEYYGILKLNNKTIFKIKDNSPNKIIVSLSCKLKDEYPDVKAKIFKKATGELVYQCQKTAIC